MSTPEQRFQTFVTRVRPHRLAVLTNIDDPHWQDSCLGIIEYFTKLWGGTHCMIVPTDGKTIDDTFWAVLSSHDPDIIYRYQRTGADEQARDADGYANLVAKEVTRAAAQENCAEDDIRGGIEKMIFEMPFGNWEVSDDLKAQLVHRLAPFHFEKQPFHNSPDRVLTLPYITRGSKPGHPLTPIADILRASERPKNVAQIVRDVGKDIAPPPLWLAASMGRGDAEYFDEMNRIGIVPMPVLMMNNRPSQILKWGINPRENIGTLFPFALTRSILSAVMDTRSRRYDLSTVVVIGDTVQDFCLYRALYWLHGRAIWLPSWFLQKVGGFGDPIMTVLRQAEENGRIEHNERLSFISFSQNQVSLEAIKQQVVASMFRTQITIDAITSETVARWLKYPSRLYAEGNVNDVSTHLLINNDLPGVFDSPLPRRLNPVNPLSHRWLVDISFLDNVVPRHPVLGTFVVRGNNVGHARTEKDAVTYMCPGSVVMGSDMETNMLRPSIHVPDAEEIFRIILADCEYTSMTSDKGRYEDSMVRKFGGLDKASYAVWSGKHRALLMKFIDPAPPVKGVKDQGVFLQSDQRRYMDFTSIEKIMGSAGVSYELIDEYVERGILYRGYIFICENCSDAAWHSISAVDQTFTCRRCDLKQQYKHQHWKMPNEPAWFYKLDEMIYLNLKNNGHVPLLTLNKLRVSSDQSFLFRPEVRITPKDSNKTFLEMDICCIPDGKLCIGEAKSNGDLAGKTLTAFEVALRYRDLALKMAASSVVFSTTDDTWNAASSQAIDAAFLPCPHVDVTVLTSADLYR